MAQETRQWDLEIAHRHSIDNRIEIEASDICGCFHCLSIFAPAEVQDWIDYGETAICPICPVDTVIASASGFPITQEFLKEMNHRWF
jgi:hypothetical protein